MSAVTVPVHAARDAAILLPVGDELFAFDVSSVREVVMAPKVTRVPTLPPGVLGVFNLRGAVLPVLDAAALVAPSTPAGQPRSGGAGFAVVARCWAYDVALVVSAMPTMARLTGPVQPSESPGAAGMYRRGDRLVTMLDLAELLTAAGLGLDQRGAEVG
ncbi:MAG TPA: chemotaxis protein CheW [Pilimelia sp.]|nr:chemotaxis protein CheW [Pilimelia sp.]